MNIVIAGYGKTGSVLTELLSEEKDVDRICCCDIKFGKKQDHKKIAYEKFDLLDDKKLTSFIKRNKADLMINATLPIYNLSLMKNSYSCRVNYLDLASDWDFSNAKPPASPYRVEQLDYDRRFNARGLVGLINAGVSPGLTNLLARECSASLDAVDDIKIRLYENNGSKDLGLAWSPEWALDEIEWKPLVYRNKKFIIKENFSEEEIFNFSFGLGNKTVVLISQEEVATIPLYIKTKNLDIKIYDNNIDAMKLIWKLGLTSEKKMRIGRHALSPREILLELLKNNVLDKKLTNAKARFAIAINTSGRKEGGLKNISYVVIFPTQEKINKKYENANFITYPSALAAKLFVLAMPLIKRKGVFPPEALGSEVRNFILTGLRSRGIKIAARKDERSMEDRSPRRTKGVIDLGL